MQLKKLIAPLLLALTLIISLPQPVEATTTTINNNGDEIIITLPVDDGFILYGKPPKPW